MRKDRVDLGANALERGERGSDDYITVSTTLWICKTTILTALDGGGDSGEEDLLQKTSDVLRGRWGPLAVDDGSEVESDKVALADVAAEGDWVGDVLGENLPGDIEAGVRSGSVEPVVGDSLGDMGPATVTVGLGTEEGGDGGEVGWAAVGWHEFV